MQPTNPVALRMWRWIPVMWYARSRTAIGIFEAQGNLLEQYNEDLQDVSDARFPQTAPSWGLDRFEQEVGLPTVPGMADAERRSRIIARFRAWGSTIYRLKSIAQAWEYGDVDIVPDPEAWALYVTFSSVAGRPLDADAHESEMRANVQAHLDIHWIYTYLTWGEVRQTGITWQQMKDAGITWDRLRTMTYSELLAIAQGGP
jgi:hypothetical protein